MSVEATKWAYDTNLKTTLKFVLVALADHANAEGVCWPSIESMVKKCTMSRSAVINNLKKLCDFEVIEKQKRYNNGKRESNVYRIKLELSPESIRTESIRTESIRTESIRIEKERVSPESGLTTIKPSLNHHYNCANALKSANSAKKSATKYSNAFLEFYETYPRKRDKKRAWKAWLKNNPGEKLNKEIFCGLKKYKTEIRLKNIEIEFVKYPAAWLNGQCWEDEYETEKQKISDEIDCVKCGNKIKRNLGLGGYCEKCADELFTPEEIKVM